MPIALQLGRLKREHMQKEKCKLIHAPIPWFQDCFFRSKSAQSSKNHAAYKRRHGRQGSATLPKLPPILAKLANETIMNSLNFSACYHNPASCAPTPLRRDTMLESFADGIFTDSHIDAMNACYLLLEQEAEDDRLRRFKEGTYLQCIQVIQCNHICTQVTPFIYEGTWRRK